MTYYFIDSTVRDRDCDRSAPIKKLVLDKLYEGFDVWPIERLQNLANSGMLWSKSKKTGDVAKVRIFYSYAFKRWIATTRADDTVCDNLLSLPIRSEARSFAVCAL